MAVDGITKTELAAARTAVLDQVRRTLAEGPPAQPICRWPDGSGWRSASAWLGQLTRTEELALVSVAVELVERIAAGIGWGDDQIRLDLVDELDAIDGRAFELAGMDRPGRAAARDTYGAVLTRSWEALVDRVAALRTYADRLLEPELAGWPVEEAWRR